MIFLGRFFDFDFLSSFFFSLSAFILMIFFSFGDLFSLFSSVGRFSLSSFFFNAKTLGAWFKVVLASLFGN